MNRAMKVIPGRADVSAEKTIGSIGSIRLSAIAIALNSTTGSLSSRSQDTHATRRPNRSTHCDSSVVLPYPGGATIANIRASAVSNRPTRAVRSTRPRRAPGGRNLDSGSPNASPGDSREIAPTTVCGARSSNATPQRYAASRPLPVARSPDADTKHRLDTRARHHPGRTIDDPPCFRPFLTSRRHRRVRQAAQPETHSHPARMRFDRGIRTDHRSYRPGRLAWLGRRVTAGSPTP